MPVAVVTTRVGKDWARARRLMMEARDPTRFKRAVDLALHEESHLMRSKMQEAFETSGQSNGKRWAPNAPSVIARKGKSTPLVDTGGMRGSIRTAIQLIQANGQIFIGIPEAARTRGGDSMIRVASVHEYGKDIAIVVTPRMFRFVMALLKRLGNPPSTGTARGMFKPGATIVIRIPERSFIRATVEAHFQPAKVSRRVYRRVFRFMGSAWDQTFPVGSI